MRKFLLIAGASLAMVSCAGSGSSTEQPSTTVLDASADALTGLLVEVGANVGTAPAEAQALEGAVLCNSTSDLDSLLVTTLDEEQCFRDAFGSSQSAVLVVASYTDEGDPIVTVQRALASGTIRVFEDSSQDSFGAGGWRSYECLLDQLSRQTEERGDSIFSIFNC